MFCMLFKSSALAQMFSAFAPKKAKQPSAMHKNIETIISVNIILYLMHIKTPQNKKTTPLLCVVCYNLY